MPLRVSTVPPDLEITTTSVRLSWPPISFSTRSMPSGSVLSKKWTRIRSRPPLSRPSAELTNCGPSAEPPMPTTSSSRNFPAGPAISPLCTLAAKSLIAASVDVMALGDLRVRRELWGAQPVVADHAFFVGIGDGASLQSCHVGERLCELGLHRVEEAVGERHAAEVERKPERGILVAELFET